MDQNIYEKWATELKEKADCILDLIDYYDSNGNVSLDRRERVNDCFTNLFFGKSEMAADQFERTIWRYLSFLNSVRKKNPDFEDNSEVSKRIQYLESLFDRGLYSAEKQLGEFVFIDKQ
jgi:hypothetical protein